MAKTMVVLEGLKELMAELQALPEACAGEAAKVIEGTANGAYVAIKGAYPSRSGDLRNGMRVSPVTKKGLIVGAEVKNVSKIAAVFDKGSEARHYLTTNGVTHLTGKMPPGKVFAPRIVHARRRLTEELKAMVVRHGAASVTEI